MSIRNVFGNCVDNDDIEGGLWKNRDEAYSKSTETTSPTTMSQNMDDCQISPMTSLCDEEAEFAQKQCSSNDNNDNDNDHDWCSARKAAPNADTDDNGSTGRKASSVSASSASSQPIQITSQRVEALKAKKRDAERYLRITKEMEGVRKSDDSPIKAFGIHLQKSRDSDDNNNNNSPNGNAGDDHSLDTEEPQQRKQSHLFHVSALTDDGFSQVLLDEEQPQLQEQHKSPADKKTNHDGDDDSEGTEEIFGRPPVQRKNPVTSLLPAQAQKSFCSTDGSVASFDGQKSFIGKLCIFLILCFSIMVVVAVLVGFARQN